MKAINNAMKELLASDSAHLVTCWQLTLGNGTNMGFTDSDEDQIYGGVTFKAATGYTRSAISTPVDLSVPNLNVQGVLSDIGITDDDIRAGLYDFAQVFIFMMVPGDVNGNQYGILKLRRGWLGQVTLTQGQHESEMRGLAQLLALNFLEVFTLECQADFGDSRCKNDLATVTDTGYVTSIGTPNSIFAATMEIEPARASQFYQFGNVTLLTGRNKGVSIEIKNWDGTNFTLYLPSGYPIEVGDQFTAVAGCDKSMATCIAKFFNLINFRGFPYIPGLDATMYPNAAQAVPTSA